MNVGGEINWYPTTNLFIIFHYTMICYCSVNPFVLPTYSRIDFPTTKEICSKSSLEFSRAVALSSLSIILFNNVNASDGNLARSTYHKKGTVFFDELIRHCLVVITTGMV